VTADPVTARTAATVSTGAVIDAARAQGRSALIAYLPIGYPDLATSLAAARAAVDGGADILELGPPYSDPLMDGPVIQHAVDAALRGGTKMADLFRTVENLAGDGAVCLVMSYWNLVDHYGVAAFAADLASAGGSGVITPDLIPDEAEQWITASDAHALDRIFLVAPSSTTARLQLTAAASRGWVYAASTMGVTGTRDQVGGGARALVERTRAAGAQRVCVGLGVSTGHQAAEVAGFADGVIVGSAFVRALTEASSTHAGVRAVHDLAQELAAGVRRGGVR